MVRTVVLAAALAVALAGCGREASVQLGGGEAAGADAGRSMTGDPDDTLGGMAPGEETVQMEPPDPGERTSRPAPPQGGVTPAATPPSAGSGEGSQPNQGIAEGEPHPADPGGCPECTTSTTPPQPTEPGQEPSHEPSGGGYTTPRPGQEDVRARSWESAEVATDDVTVTITWWSGVEPCTVLDHVDVVEESGRVVITLYEGNAPGDEGACPAIAVEKRTQVTLSAPLAGREIVDGAAT